MGAETRYFRSDTEVVDGVTFYKLLTANTNSLQIVNNSPALAYLGIKVYTYTAAGVKTCISGANCVAVAFITTTLGERDGTWTPPQTPLNNTDRIIVEVYNCDAYGQNGVLMASFITEQIGATQLDAVLWTVHYWCRAFPDIDTDSFYFGHPTRNSRITNFSWSIPPKVKAGLHPSKPLSVICSD